MTSRQDDRLDELERLNLEYMALYIRFKPPSGPLRTFLDDWFAYHSGGSFLNRLFPEPPTEQPVTLVM